MLSLDYGNSKVRAELKADILTPVAMTANTDVNDAIDSVLTPLRGCHRVVVVVPDPTRPAAHERVLPSLAPHLMGKDVILLVACGAHGRPQESFLQQLQSFIPSAEVIVHDCDTSPMIRIGVTKRGTPVDVNAAIIDAQLAIGIGSVAIHPFAGFSGGPKVFVPGCASRTTITFNHSLLVQAESGPAQRTDNPVYEDLLEAASLLTNTIIINEALSPDGHTLGTFAGAIASTHQRAANLALQAASTEIAEQYHLVIASCGGYPRDINLYQAVKALDMASHACVPGGQLILLAECREGIGSKLYEEWARKPFAEQEQMVMKAFLAGAHKAYLAGRILKRLGQAILVSSLPPETARAMGFAPASSLEQALELARANERQTIAAIPYGTTTLPIVK